MNKKLRIRLLAMLTMIMLFAMTLPVFAAESTATSVFDCAKYTVGGISIIGLIIGLVKVARELGMSSKFASGLAVLLGIVVGVTAAQWAGSAIYQGVLGGIAAGLMSCGIYDVGKATLSSSTTDITTPVATGATAAEVTE